MHCVFNWKKLHRMQDKLGKVLKPRYAEIGHIKHCGKVFLIRGNLEEALTFQDALLTSGM